MQVVSVDPTVKVSALRVIEACMLQLDYMSIV